MTVFIMVSVYLGLFGIDPQKNTGSFLAYLAYAVSVLATMGFGYLINDYYDVETDKINKPGKNPFEKYPSFPAATGLGGLVSASIVIPFCASLLGQLPSACIWINFAALALLYAYAHAGKSSVLWGNFLVAALTVWLFVGIYFACGDARFKSPALYMRLFWMYAFFSFSLTVTREIVKDAEDHEGDLKSGVMTLATRYGTAVSKRWAWGTLLPMPLLLVGMAYLVYEDSFRKSTALGILAVYGIFTLFILWYSREKAGFRRTSLALKIYMILGILSMWL